MSKFRFARRPSPALVVACCALFVALSGTSYAVAIGSVGSPQVRDDSLRGIDVRNRSLTGHDVRRDSLGGGAIKEETLDVSKLELPDADGPLHALVTFQGRYANARGVEDVDHLQEGIYNVVFDRDVSACVSVATIRSDMAIGLPSAGTGEIVVRPAFEDVNAVRVHTADSQGQLADHDFTLIVSC